MNILLSDDIARLIKEKDSKEKRFRKKDLHNKLSDSDSPLTIEVNGVPETVSGMSYNHTQYYFSNTKAREYPGLVELMNLVFWADLNFKSFVGLITKKLIEELYFGLLLFHCEKEERIIASMNISNEEAERIIEDLLLPGNNHTIANKINVHDIDFGRKNKVELGGREIEKFGYQDALRNLDLTTVQKDQKHLSFRTEDGLVYKTDSSKHILLSKDVTSNLRTHANHLGYLKKELMIADNHPEPLFFLILEMISKNVFAYETGTKKYCDAMDYHTIKLDSGFKKQHIEDFLRPVAISQCHDQTEDITVYIKEFLNKLLDAILELVSNLNLNVFTVEVDVIDTIRNGEPHLLIRTTAFIPRVSTAKVAGVQTTGLTPFEPGAQIAPEHLQDICRSWKVDMHADKVIFSRSFPA